MRVLLLGASGTLGKELQKLHKDLICPTHSFLDITDEERVIEYVLMKKPDIIINAAAVLTNNPPEKAISTNIIGGANIANACIKNNIRLVLISTDYVYKGDKGNYSEESELLPFNFYAWTKLGSECSARGVKNHLIIRTSFGKSEFPYPQAFSDKFASKDYVDVIAPLILEVALSDITGVLNIGTDKKTLFEYAKQRNPDVKPVKVSDSKFSSPIDTSLNLQKWIDFKTNKNQCKSVISCRICNDNKLSTYLNLGNLPLVNNLSLSKEEALNAERFPLAVQICNNCKLSQLTVTVDPELLFSNYFYRSAISNTYKNHCFKMANSINEKYNLGNNVKNLVIDVAGNDCTLLKEFNKVISNIIPINIDPAKNLCQYCQEDNIATIPAFLDENVAKYVIDNLGKAKIVVSTNVLAHVSNIVDFTKSIKLILDDDGIWILEFPYFLNYIDNMEFDTTYHEHISYLGILPLNKLFSSLDMKIVDIEEQNIHGGTLRVHISQKNSKYPTMNIDDFLTKEEWYSLDYLKTWSRKVNKLINTLKTEIESLKERGYKIAAFGAAAKGNTLLNSAKITNNTINYIVDETPEKIGKFSPGTGIPIVDIKEFLLNPPDYLIILAWNFKNEIMDKCRKLGFKGKFIIPIPQFEIIE